jgi:hypothetical protein
VLGSLRSTRPERIGGDRRAAARSRTSATTALADEAARAKPAATKPSKPGPTKAEAKAAKKPKPAKAKPSKPAATTSSAAKPAKVSKAKAKPKAAKAKPPAKAAKVKPVKRVVPKPAATSRPQPPLESDGGPPRGAEIVTTAVQAAGELAQIGVTVGGQMLRRAARRLPRR